MLKAAVIGVGMMGQHHARIYSQIPETQLVGVVDIQEKSAEQTARLYHTTAYTDYHKLLDEARPEIVTIATPTEFHHCAALAALEAGCHLLIEKPIALTETEAQEIIERAELLDRKLMIGHVVRFDPAVQALKERLQAGELGRIFQIRCRRLGPFPARIRDVGVVIDLATHDLDMIRYLTGREAVRLYAETEQRIHSAYEDILVGTIRMADGVIGILDINWLTPTKIRELTVTGEKGMFVVDHLTQDLFFYENAETQGEGWSAIRLLRGVSEGRMIRYPIQKYEPLKAELTQFAQAVIDNKPVPVTGQDGLLALRLARALVQSGREGRAINL
jgi:predicted dehydrogenase